MPQASSSRKESNPQLKALDKESKRARGALSCAECRRLKLKCDKTVPCASCKRRGCSAICPNGSLITGQGTRFVLADTEKLHQKIAQMSDRIRQLEDAVAILQSTLSSEPHPLLSRELLKIKSSIELHAAVDDDVLSSQGISNKIKDRQGGEEEEGESVIDAFGTLAIRDDGAATFYGRSAGSESLLIGEPSPQVEDAPIHISLHQPQPLPVHQTNHLIQQQYHISQNSPPAITASTSTSSNQQASIAALSASFPLSTNAFQSIQIDMDYLLIHHLPKWDEAWRLTQLYLEQAPWFFGAVTKKQLVEEMLPMWYFEARGTGLAGTSPGSTGMPLTPVSPVDGQAANAASPGSYSTTSSSSSTTQHPSASKSPQNSIHGTNKKQTRTAHDLALLFMIFCFGALTDIQLPAAPENLVSEEYYQLTKATLVLEPVLERPPSVATVQTLSLMAIYEGICSKDGSIERTWSLFGLAVKLAQSIGLHRDCARWKLSTAEVQKRRALFWELFITDCWQSLATGRLATFSLPFVDCELPMDPDSTIADDGSIQPSFPYWKARFGAECVSAVVQGTLTSRAPKYSIILDLDRKVRDMELPLYAQQAQNMVMAATAAAASSSSSSSGISGIVAGTMGEAEPVLDLGAGVEAGLGLGDTMSRFMPINYRELTLLYIHRCFFAHAISTHPSDPIKSQYAPSFLAGYRSACTILGSVRQQFWLFPRQIARFWVLWTHAFSATVMLASVATHVSKQSQVAHAALIELNSACELFENAAKHGGRAVKFLPILQRLRAKAQKSFEDDEKGLPPNIPNDILKPSRTDEEKNELEIFSGKTHTVATRSPAVKRMNSSGSLTSSRASSGSPQVKPIIQAHLQVPGQAPGHPPMYTGQQQPQPPVQQQQVPVPQQQQLMNQYPAFEGVHPSLVHELRGFDGRIEAQVRQAYVDNAGPYNTTGVIREEEEPVVHVGVAAEEPAGTGPVGVGASGNMVGVEFHQEQQQREMEYQQQMQMEAERERLRMEEEERRRVEMERERAERERAEKRERERQEYEMQRARQQQQQQQYHAPYPPQPAYQPQPQQHPQYDGYYGQGESVNGRVQHQGMPPPPPPAAPQAPRHRPSSSSLRQAYGQETMYHHQGQPTPSPAPQYQHQHQHQQHAQHPQQQLHVVLPQQQYVNTRDPLSTPSSATMSPYDAQGSYSQPQVPQVQYSHSPPHQQPQQSYPQATYTQYWAAAPNAVQEQAHIQQGYPAQQEHHVQYTGQYPGQVHPGHSTQYQHPHQPQPQPQQQQQQYTPTGVLRGIAADDSRLQETWTTYMYNVASPRPFFED